MGYDRNKVIKTAESQVGYLEKSRAAYIKYGTQILYEMTKGAGNDNYTKYGLEMHKIYPTVMDFPASWCDCFVDWCFYKTYGVSTAKSLLAGNFDDYTVASAKKYKDHNALDNTPEVGAQIFFTRNGNYTGCYHTGLVVAVSKDKKTVTTIEGNTSASGTNVVANGGCVAKKVRSVTINTLFGHPKYDDGYGIVKPKKSVDTIAQEVIDGKWGSGLTRKLRLKAAGYNYDEVQKAVNDKLAKKTAPKKSVDTIATEVIAGKWGYGQDRINRLIKAGYDPDAVQKAVNAKLQK